MDLSCIIFTFDQISLNHTYCSFDCEERKGDMKVNK